MKKRIVFLLSLLLLCVCAGAEGRLYALPTEESVLIFDEEGALLPGEYQGLYMVTPPELPASSQRAAARGLSGGEYLMNMAGEALTEPVYSFFSWQDGYIVFCSSERFGLMDLEGREVLPGVYTWLMSNGEGAFFALRTAPWDDTPDALYLVAPDGTERDLALRVSMVPQGSEGLFLTYASALSAYGYLNAQGEWAIEPAFAWASVFAGECAAASDGRAVGIIDRTGEWRIAPTYENLTMSGGENLYAVGEAEGFAEVVSTADQSVIARYAADAVHCADGYSVVYGPEEIVLLNPEGGEASRFSRQEVRSIDLYQGSRYLTRSTGEWGEHCVWIDTRSGEPVSGPYQSVSFLASGEETDYFVCRTFECEVREFPEYGRSFRVEVPGTLRAGIITASGERVTEVDYSAIRPLSRHCAAGLRDGEWTLIRLE